jgi:hypothetical protein
VGKNLLGHSAVIVEQKVLIRHNQPQWKKKKKNKLNAPIVVLLN